MKLSRGLLRAWFQYSQDKCLFAPLDAAQYSASMTVEEVLALGTTLDSCLLASYKGMVDTANTPECREIFENLLLMEKQEKHKLARVALEINDM